MAKRSKGNKTTDKKPEESKYQKKLRERYLFEKESQAIETATPQEKYHSRQGAFRSPKFKVTTFIRLTINKYDAPGAVIYPSSPTNSIYSLLITRDENSPVYRLTKRVNRKGGETPEPIKTKKFGNLYQNEWVDKTRQAQLELYTIQQTIEAKRGDLEKHLGLELRLD